MWRVEDGKEVATLEAKGVQCLAVSKDGRWIAAGTAWGDVSVWSAKTYDKVISKTYEKVISQRKDHYSQILGVDFSPDSTRLVSAASHNRPAIWDITTREQIRTLGDHGDWVRAAKYSPQGDRIATATLRFVRVWDSNDGHLLMDIRVNATPWYNTGLRWFNDHLLVISDRTIKQFEASTGSAISEWSVADANNTSSITLPQHREFIAYSTNRTVSLWHTSETHTQLGFIQHRQDIRSIVVSPDDRFLAIAGQGGKITINSLSRIIVSILACWIVNRMNNFLTLVIFS